MVAIRDLSWPHLIPIKQPSRRPSQQISRSISSQNVKQIDSIGIQRRPTRRVSEGDNPIPVSELHPKHELIPEPTIPMAPAATPVSPQTNALATPFIKPTSAVRTEKELQENRKILDTDLPRQEVLKPVKSPALSRPPLLRQKSPLVSPTSPMQLLEPFPFEEITEEGSLVSSVPGSNNSNSPGSFVSRHDKQYELRLFSTDSIMELIQLIPDTPIGGATPNVPDSLTPAGAYPTPALSFLTAPTSPMTVIMDSAYDGPATSVPSSNLPTANSSALPSMPVIKTKGFAHPLSECSTPSTIAVPASNTIDSLPIEGIPSIGKSLPKWTGTLPQLGASSLNSLPVEGIPNIGEGLPNWTETLPSPGASPLDSLPTDAIPGNLPSARIPTPTPTQGITRAVPLGEMPIEAVTHPLPADTTGALPVPVTPLPNVSKVVKAKKRVGKVAKVGRRVVLRKPVLAIVVGRQLAGPTATLLKMVSRGDPLPDAIGMVGKVGAAVPIPVGDVTGAVPKTATSALPV